MKLHALKLRSPEHKSHAIGEQHDTVVKNEAPALQPIRVRQATLNTEHRSDSSCWTEATELRAIDRDPLGCMRNLPLAEASRFNTTDSAPP